MRNNKNNSKELRVLNVALIDFGVRPTKDQSITIQAEKIFNSYIKSYFFKINFNGLFSKICV